jgi:hypothetical protein
VEAYAIAMFFGVSGDGEGWETQGNTKTKKERQTDTSLRRKKKECVR